MVGGGHYSRDMVGKDSKAPVQINLSDPVGKTVGRRKFRGPSWNTVTGSKAEARRWRQVFPTPFIPKGVWRFRTHEEADEWMWKMITRPPAK